MRSWDSVDDREDTEPFSALVELGDEGADGGGGESCWVVDGVGLVGWDGVMAVVVVVVVVEFLGNGVES